MSDKLCRFYLLLIFLFSILLTAVFFNPSDFFSASPIYSDDYSLHLSQCITTKWFFSQFGKCWAYDPFFLAGFPNGALVNADNKAWELFYIVLSPVFGDGLAFKLYVIFFLVIYPFFIYGSARNFNLSKEQSLVSCFLAILFFHLSLAIDFVYWGMVSYVFTCFFSIYVFSLFYKLFEMFTWKRYITVTLLASILFMQHILSLVHIIIPMLVLYILNFKRISPFRHIFILLIPVVILVVNSYWLVPVIAFINDKTTLPGNYEFTLQIKSIVEPLKVYIDQRKTIDYKPQVLNNTFIDVFLLVCGSYGFYLWSKKKFYNLLFSFGSGILFIFIVAFYGSCTTFFAQLQPERFTVALSLLLIIPAAGGVFLAGKKLLQRRQTTTILFILWMSFACFYRPVIRPFGTFFHSKQYRLNCIFPEHLKELLAFLQKNTTNEGRILLEDSEYTKNNPIHEYYGGHYPALFPEYVKREYLCGPRPMYPIKHSYASFTNGMLFEKNINEYTFKELQTVFDIYNVKWIVCWYKKSKDFFNQFPEYIIKIAEVDKFIIYEIKRKSSFFLRGSGVVRSDYNRLELQQVKAEDNEIILAYHWMKQLKAVPDAKIEKAVISGDPIGFIKIKNPPPALIVINSY